MILKLNEEKIFVAGATGMVGSSVCRKLMKINTNSERFENFVLTPNRSQLDLLNYENVKDWFEINKPSIVIIAAAKVGGILANSQQPANFILENIKIQTNIIESAWRSGTKRLLFLGSSCIYPRITPQPIKEEYLLSGNLENTNLSYAIAKIAGIKLCESLRVQYGFDAISLLPTNLFGPNDNYHAKNSHVMAALIQKFCLAKEENLDKVTCWGSGSPLREFMHVDDLADAIIFCLENWDPDSSRAPKDSKGNKLYHLNVGTGKDISIKDLAETISDTIDYKGGIIWDKTKPDGTPRKLLDTSGLSSLGWSPKIKFNDGVKMTIDDFISNNFKK